jgi:hypothetical protein
MISSVTTTSQQVYFDAFLVLGMALQHCCPRAKSAISKCTHGVVQLLLISQYIAVFHAAAKWGLSHLIQT